MDNSKFNNVINSFTMRVLEIINEDPKLRQMKQEIVQAIDQFDLDTDDQEEIRQTAKILDHIYTVLNKTKVLSRISDVIPKTLQGEYQGKAIREIAEKIATAPISFAEKEKFLANLEKNKVIDEKILLKPGDHTLEALTYNDPVNLAMFHHMKAYGVGQQMKGPAEHALAIFNKNISIKGKGDVTVGTTPVEIKAYVGTNPSAGGGRLGEASAVPTREKIVQILTGIPSIAAAVEEHLETQKSLNLTTLTLILNQLNIPAGERKKIATTIFREIFGKHAQLVITEISKANANPEAVRMAYAISNFNWYKDSDMGGQWQILAALNFANNKMTVIRNGEDLAKVSLYSKTPSIITTDKPQEMLYQMAPR